MSEKLEKMRADLAKAKRCGLTWQKPRSAASS